MSSVPNFRPRDRTESVFTQIQLPAEDRIQLHELEESTESVFKTIPDAPDVEYSTRTTKALLDSGTLVIGHIEKAPTRALLSQKTIEHGIAEHYLKKLDLFSVSLSYDRGDLRVGADAKGSYITLPWTSEQNVTHALKFYLIADETNEFDAIISQEKIMQLNFYQGTVGSASELAIAGSATKILANTGSVDNPEKSTLEMTGPRPGQLQHQETDLLEVNQSKYELLLSTSSSNTPATKSLINLMELSLLSIIDYSTIFIAFLIDDQFLKFLYKSLIRQLGPDRFVEIFYALLTQYSVKLNRTAHNLFERQVASCVHGLAKSAAQKIVALYKGSQNPTKMRPRYPELRQRILERAPNKLLKKQFSTTPKSGHDHATEENRTYLQPSILERENQLDMTNRFLSEGDSYRDLQQRLRRVVAADQIKLLLANTNTEAAPMSNTVLTRNSHDASAVHETSVPAQVSETPLSLV